MEEDRNNIYYESRGGMVDPQKSNIKQRNCLCICFIIIMLYFSYIAIFIHMVAQEEGSQGD